MRPWQVVSLFAILLNGLIAIAMAITGNSDRISEIIAGALLPVVISGTLLFWVDHNKIHNAQRLQKINIIGFFLKIILFGLWSVTLIKSGTLDKMTFIVILLINFLAWHGVEAYYWPLFRAGNGQENGEES